MTRQEANLKLLEILKTKIYQYPDLRFSQLLFAVGAVNQAKTKTMLGSSCLNYTSACLPYWDDEYHLESEDLLLRVTKAAKNA